jgi:O-acetyl-ADP-ribose deacetylase (regulator of RNase III)
MFDPVQLTLVDSSHAVVDSLRASFAPFAEVSVFAGDLLALAENAVVSPANGYGFMDGGIDAAYATVLPDVERRVRDAIARRPEGFLPVGAAVIVPVEHAQIEFVIAAATMLMPEMVDADNAYRALRAVLCVASAHGEHVRSIYCPGLCTGVGAVPAMNAARAMAAAYADWRKDARAG